MIADVEIDQKIDRARRGRVVPFDLVHMIDHRHRAGGGDARNLRRIAERRRQQDSGDPVLGHQFSFGNRGDGDSASAVRDLAPRDLDALVRFGVRTKLLAGLLHAPRHARQVRFEKIEIEQQRRRRDLIFREHRSIMYDDRRCAREPRFPRLQPTAVNAILAEVRALQAQGKSLVSLMRGEPDFPTPAHIVEASIRALRNGRTSYPDNRGEKTFREAVAQKLERDNQPEIRSRNRSAGDHGRDVRHLRGADGDAE